MWIARVGAGRGREVVLLRVVDGGDQSSRSVTAYFGPNQKTLDILLIS